MVLNLVSVVLNLSFPVFNVVFRFLGFKPDYCGSKVGFCGFQLGYHGSELRLPGYKLGFFVWIPLLILALPPLCEGVLTNQRSVEERYISSRSCCAKLS